MSAPCSFAEVIPRYESPNVCAACDSERRLSHYDTAIEYCQKSLNYDPKYAYAHYDLGLAYLLKANSTAKPEELYPTALTHMKQVIEIDPDLAQADSARKYIQKIQAALQNN